MKDEGSEVEESLLHPSSFILHPSSFARARVDDLNTRHPQMLSFLTCQDRESF